MSKPTSAVKRKYNKAVYRRYEFSIKLDSKLNYKLEQYKADSETDLSELIRGLLCQHFGVDTDEIYAPYHLLMVTDNGCGCRMSCNHIRNGVGYLIRPAGKCAF